MKKKNKLMGLVQTIQKKQLKSFTKGACKSMLAAFEKGKKKFPNANYRDLLCFTLSTRPRWKQVGNFKFKRRSGEEIDIDKEDKLEDVVRKMVFFEAANQGFFKYDNLNEKAEKFTIVVREISNFFKKHKE